MCVTPSMLAAFIFNNSAPILADKFHSYNQVLLYILYKNVLAIVFAYSLHFNVQVGLAQGLWGISFALGSVIGPIVGGGLLNVTAPNVQGEKRYIV